MQGVGDEACGEGTDEGNVAYLSDQLFTAVWMYEAGGCMENRD